MLYRRLSSLRCRQHLFPFGSQSPSVGPSSFHPPVYCRDAEWDATHWSPPGQRQPARGGLQQAEQRSRTWPRPGVPQPLRSGSVSLPQLPTKQSRRSIKRLGLLSGARPCAEIDGVSVAVCWLHGDTGPATCTVTYVSDGVWKSKENKNPARITKVLLSFLPIT